MTRRTFLFILACALATGSFVVMGAVAVQSQATSNKVDAETKTRIGQIQGSRLEACRGANENNRKLLAAIHEVFLGDNPAPSARTLAAIALFDEALAPRDCEAVVR